MAPQPYFSRTIEHFEISNLGQKKGIGLSRVGILYYLGYNVSVYNNMRPYMYFSKVFYLLLLLCKENKYIVSICMYYVLRPLVNSTWLCWHGSLKVYTTCKCVETKKRKGVSIWGGGECLSLCRGKHSYDNGTMQGDVSHTYVHAIHLTSTSL